MSASTPPAALHEAIEWMVRLGSGRAGARERRAFEDWLAAAGEHRAAWAQVDGVLAGPLQSIREAERRQPGHAAATLETLSRPAARRRAALGGFAGLLVAGAGALAVHRQAPLDTLAADLRTGTGERRRVPLGDGSVLTLNARSAVDLDFGTGLRRVRLRAGALMADVVARGDAPFVVETAQGRVQALGTRFMVALEDARTRVAVLAHAVEVHTASGARRRLEAGEATVFETGAIEAPSADALARAAWTDGRLEVRDAPLGEVIAALQPYQAGFIRVSPQAARLRVFGVFALDRPAQVLQDLVDTLPIRVRTWGPMLTLVDAEPA